MALTGYDPQSVVDFISKSDTTPPHTVFHVRRTLNKREDIDIEDSVWESKGLGKKQHQQWRAGSRRWKILEAMFTGAGCGWENFQDSSGTLIPFSIANIQMIRADVQDELIEFVKPAKLDADDEQD